MNPARCPARFAGVALSLVLVSRCAQDGSGPSIRPSPPDVTSSPRKGVGTWYFPGQPTVMGDVGVSWYYTCGSTTSGSGRRPPGVEFVPMVRDETHASPDELAQAVASGTGVLLGYNEPDVVQQANMPVEQALDAWPLLKGTGMRLGGPATAAGHNKGSVTACPGRLSPRVCGSFRRSSPPRKHAQTA